MSNRDFENNGEELKNEHIEPAAEESVDDAQAAEIEAADVLSDETAQQPAPKKTGRVKAFFRRRSVRYGSVATAFTALFIVAVVIVNIVLTAVVNKYPLNIDLTSNKDYQLSSQTLNYLKKLKTPVDVYVIDTAAAFQKDSTLQYVYKTIKQYPMYNTDIKISYIDIQSNPTFKSKFASETLSTGDIIVANGSRYKHLTQTDLIATSTDSTYGQQYPTGNQSEQAVTSALLYVTNTNLPKVILTSGHNEQNFSGLQSLLSKNNYEVKTQSIASTAIDSGTKMIAIVDPTVDFTSDEITKLDGFLNNNGKYGKSLMVFFDPSEPSLPNLENYLDNYWGIKVQPGFVYDSTNNQQYAYYPLGTSFDSDVLSSVSTTIPFIMPLTRPLTLSYDSRNNNTTKSLVKSYNTSQVWVPKTAGDTNFNPTSSDKKGPFTTMAMSTKSMASGGEDLLYSRVLVSGGTGLIDSNILSYSSFSNQELAITVANYLGGYKPSVSILSKNFETSTLTISTAQKIVLGIVFIFLLPIIMIVLGLTVWLRRRHL